MPVLLAKSTIKTTSHHIHNNAKFQTEITMSKLLLRYCSVFLYSPQSALAQEPLTTVRRRATWVWFDYKFPNRFKCVPANTSAQYSARPDGTVSGKPPHPGRWKAQ
jgi:hypothetical protein